MPKACNQVFAPSPSVIDHDSFESLLKLRKYKRGVIASKLFRLCPSLSEANAAQNEADAAAMAAKHEALLAARRQQRADAKAARKLKLQKLREQRAELKQQLESKKNELMEEKEALEEKWKQERDQLAEINQKLDTLNEQKHELVLKLKQALRTEGSIRRQSSNVQQHIGPEGHFLGMSPSAQHPGAMPPNMGHAAHPLGGIHHPGASMYPYVVPPGHGHGHGGMHGGPAHIPLSPGTQHAAGMVHTGAMPPSVRGMQYPTQAGLLQSPRASSEHPASFHNGPAFGRSSLHDHLYSPPRQPLDAPGQAEPSDLPVPRNHSLPDRTNSGMLMSPRASNLPTPREHASGTGHVVQHRMESGERDGEFGGGQPVPDPYNRSDMDKSEEPHPGPVRRDSFGARRSSPERWRSSHDPHPYDRCAPDTDGRGPPGGPPSAPLDRSGDRPLLRPGSKGRHSTDGREGGREGAWDPAWEAGREDVRDTSRDKPPSRRPHSSSDSSSADEGEIIEEGEVLPSPNRSPMASSPEEGADTSGVRPPIRTSKGIPPSQGHTLLPPHLAGSNSAMHSPRVPGGSWHPPPPPFGGHLPPHLKHVGGLKPMPLGPGIVDGPFPGRGGNLASPMGTPRWRPPPPPPTWGGRGGRQEHPMPLGTIPRRPSWSQHPH